MFTIIILCVYFAVGRWIVHIKELKYGLLFAMDECDLVVTDVAHNFLGHFSWIGAMIHEQTMMNINELTYKKIRGWNKTDH